jgi:hypothetical protein
MPGSFRFSTRVMRCAGATVTLPRLATIRTHEPTAGLARKIAEGRAKILSATVSRSSAGSCRSPWRSSVTSRSVIGGQRRRLASTWGSGTCGAPHEASVVGIPSVSMHFTRPRRCWPRYETVVTEALNVAGMQCNRRLARSLSDQSFGKVRQQLGSKTVWRGGRLIVAERFFPSSTTYSACGTVTAKLSLAERVYRCDGCGLVIDRDVNAARNLLMLAVSGRG